MHVRGGGEEGEELPGEGGVMKIIKTIFILKKIFGKIGICASKIFNFSSKMCICLKQNVCKNRTFSHASTR